MKRSTIYSLMFLYLGFVLTFFLKIDLESYKFWIIMLPIILIVAYQERNTKD